MLSHLGLEERWAVCHISSVSVYEETSFHYKWKEILAIEFSFFKIWKLFYDTYHSLGCREVPVCWICTFMKKHEHRCGQVPYLNGKHL